LSSKEPKKERGQQYGYAYEYEYLRQINGHNDTPTNDKSQMTKSRLMTNPKFFNWALVIENSFVI